MDEITAVAKLLCESEIKTDKDSVQNFILDVKLLLKKVSETNDSKKIKCNAQRINDRELQELVSDFESEKYTIIESRIASVKTAIRYDLGLELF